MPTDCQLGSFRAGLAANAACGGEPLRASAARRLRLARLRRSRNFVAANVRRNSSRTGKVAGRSLRSDANSGPPRAEASARAAQKGRILSPQMSAPELLQMKPHLVVTNVRREYSRQPSAPLGRARRLLRNPIFAATYYIGTDADTFRRAAVLPQDMPPSTAHACSVPPQMLRVRRDVKELRAAIVRYKYTPEYAELFLK